MMTNDIDQLKIKIISLHAQAHGVIMDRENIEEPLNPAQAELFKKLNIKCEGLQNELKKLQARLERIKEDKEPITITLTPSEKLFLNILKEHYPMVLSSTAISVLLNVKRNRVSEHLRKFLIARMVSYAGISPGRDGYKLSLKGLDYLNEEC